MVVKETLRLHPGNPLLLKESMKHCMIDGYNVYPKTTVLINAWEIGRNPKYWQNPEEFLPERFKDRSHDFAASHYNFEYLPFGGGRKGCPGISMGLVLTELVLANVLYAFDWELPKGLKKEDINMEVSSGSSVHKKYPLELVPIETIYG
ncbi:cytochrome P450 71A1-like [Papaver somniferum]|uniref:cytochrome P450 71A1-like n=1 Tax=Papaver somniferum TaxID=3469 RepID=UPI000E6FCBE5|nr:cytochrome P450 71A1-like [Papaver somniferum]